MLHSDIIYILQLIVEVCVGDSYSGSNSLEKKGIA